MPDLTKAQILATVKAAIAVAVAFGVPLHPTQQIALLALTGSLAGLLIAADAAIRRGRAQHVAAPLLDKQAAEAIAAARSTSKSATIESEAAAEKAAQQANDAAAAGIDPATQG
jgi:hypothetical protein